MVSIKKSNALSTWAREAFLQQLCWCKACQENRIISICGPFSYYDPHAKAHSLADPKSCSSSKKLEVLDLLVICFSFCCFHSGFVIPKGWRIYVYTREINYDPHIYPDPLSFNPWRWLVSRLLFDKVRTPL